MGGRIDAQSTLGKGSRFTVLLPYRPAAEAPATTHSASLPPQPEAGNALMGIRVLLAEDDEINRIVAEDLQSEAGAKVTSVTNGSEVVERVAADGPEGCDVILMDIQMPVMDGFEATNKIQVIAPDLPIISLSAHAIEEERVRFEEAGMAAHVTKPFIRIISSRPRCFIRNRARGHISTTLDDPRLVSFSESMLQAYPLPNWLSSKPLADLGP